MHCGARHMEYATKPGSHKIMFHAHHQRIIMLRPDNRVSSRHWNHTAHDSDSVLGAGTNWSPIDEPTDSYTPVCSQNTVLVVVTVCHVEFSRVTLRDLNPRRDATMIVGTNVYWEKSSVYRATRALQSDHPAMGVRRQGWGCNFCKRLTLAT